jgi:hypothetical protein
MNESFLLTLQIDPIKFISPLRLNTKNLYVCVLKQIIAREKRYNLLIPNDYNISKASFTMP